MTTHLYTLLGQKFVDGPMMFHDRTTDEQKTLISVSGFPEGITHYCAANRGMGYGFGPRGFYLLEVGDSCEPLSPDVITHRATFSEIRADFFRLA